MALFAATYRRSLIMAIISTTLLCTHCIVPYEPDIHGRNGLLVVDGSLIKGLETQVITISRTSVISKPEFMPVQNCHVKIMDNNGTEFEFQESSPGKYVANIDDAVLNYDMQYKLIFSTSSGDNYESDYQVLLQTCPVDSAYALVENHYSTVTESETLSGYQFYIDLNAPQDASRYYRWVLEETWTRILDNEIWGLYDGVSFKKFDRRDSLQQCWVTEDVKGLYAASTVALSTNQMKKVPLHFVEKDSPKMNNKYCATIRQYALNPDAYEYWYEKEKELNESGNIYSIQPSQPKSNVHNLNNPGEMVMGFFWAASSSVKRVFVDPHNLRSGEAMACRYIGVYCESQDYNDIVAALYPAFTAFAEELPEPPIYIAVEKSVSYHIVITPPCADCRVLGGDAHKPDFWKWDE